MKQNLLAIFLLSIILLQSCCKKNEPAPDPYHNYKMPHEMLDYGYFKPGTYWVYQDSISGAIDSVWVFNCNYGIDTLSKDNSNGLPQGVYDYFETKTRSSYFNADYYYWSNSSWTSKLNGYKSILWRERVISGHSVLEGSTFFYPIVIGEKLFNANYDTLKIINFSNSYLCSSSVYLNVVELRQNKNNSEDGLETIFYYAKGVCLIEKHIPFRNEYWKLIKYQIQQ